MNVVKTSLSFRIALLGSVTSMAVLWSAPTLAQDAASSPQSVAGDGLVQDDPASEMTDAAPPAGDRIIVTGSRVARDGAEAPTPVTVIGEERFAARATTNVADALNELPSFRASTSPATQQAVAGNIGARVLDLRGLGATRTLVLVDGKRFVPSTQQGTIDINLIPSALVQRAEIVTGGASAAYGSDAVAGVVNFILDRQLEGLKVTAQLGLSQESDNDEQYFSAAYGTSFAGGRGHLLFSAEYANSEGLGDCYSRDWCPNEMLVGNSPAGFGGFPASLRAGPNQTGNISHDGLITAGPLRGTTFNSDGSLRQYQYGTIYGSNPSPLFAVGGEDALYNGFLSGILLIPPVERYTAFASASYELTDSITASLDLSYGRVQGEVFGSAPRGTYTITRDNAFLPAELAAEMDANGLTSVALGRAFTDVGNPNATSDNQTYRAVASVEGDIGGGWGFDAYYQYGRNDFEQSYTNNMVLSRMALAVNAVDTGNGAVCRVNADSDPANDAPGCVPFNIFGRGNGSAEALNYVATDGFQTALTNQHVVAATVNGGLFELPGGEFKVAAGAEWRQDSISGQADALSTANAFWSFNGKAIAGKIEVAEGFVEAVAPILSDVSFAELLELNGAIRQTHYTRSNPTSASTDVDVTTWKLGAVWEPFDFLRLRGTRSRDIRAPNLSELFGAVSAGRTTIVDPATNGTQIQITAFQGGNPELAPEKADTWTVGAVLDPAVSFGRRLTLSVDYFDISIEDAVSALGAQTIVQSCFDGDAGLCDLVVRDSGNQLVSVNNALINVGEQKNRGIDFELGYTTFDGPMGSLDLRLLATRYLELTIGNIDRAGQTGFRAGTITGVPDWTLDGFLGWKKDALTVGLHGRYISKGVYDVSFIGPDADGYAPTLTNSIDDNTVDDAFTLDLNLGYEVEDGVELFAVVNNLLNADPPLAASAQGGTNQVFFDPIGRYFRVGFRARLP